MRKVIFPVAFVAVSTLAACSFQMRAGTGANQPAASSTPPPGATPTAPATTPRPAPVLTGPVRRLGKRPPGQATGPTPAPTNTSTAPAPAPTTPPAPTGAPVVSGATVFGSGTIDPAGFKGTLYWVDKNTTKVPPLESMHAAGFLFTKELNIAPQAFSSGFPGVDAARKENFAIRYEAPLVVTTEADYDFRIVAEDGAKVLIDGMAIVDNDGVKTAPAEKTGPVHLVAGTHVITVDYLQTTGNVALQLFCKKANDAEKVCPTQL
ncbi:MAG TPA: PA14 domain-containing protein [Labilithrix sp.]|nr:PA14 domain-containing protein [Labilithrix sp.]